MVATRESLIDVAIGLVSLVEACLGLLIMFEDLAHTADQRVYSLLMIAAVTVSVNRHSAQYERPDSSSQLWRQPQEWRVGCIAVVSVALMSDTGQQASGSDARMIDLQLPQLLGQARPGKHLACLSGHAVLSGGLGGTAGVDDRPQSAGKGNVSSKLYTTCERCRFKATFHHGKAHLPNLQTARVCFWTPHSHRFPTARYCPA
jgi:hypothetical protein